MTIRHLLALASLPILSALCLSSCSATGKLPPCQAPNARLWCHCEVAQTTEARAAAGLPVACTIPFVATSCVDSHDAVGGFMEFVSRLGKFNVAYSGPGGWPPYLVVGENAYWLRCPVKLEGGGSDCITNGQPTNPWPSWPVADLDSANPIKPGLRSPPRGGGVPGPPGGGGDGVGGGSGESGDCSLCLADAPCSGLTQDQCVTMHCAAVCPWDSNPAMTCEDTGGGVITPTCAASGEGCSADMVCCEPLACMAGGTCG